MSQRDKKWELDRKKIDQQSVILARSFHPALFAVSETR
jgi:hypothetical protein